MVDVTVVGPGGTSAVSSSDQFTYDPVLTRISPALWIGSRRHHRDDHGIELRRRHGQSISAARPQPASTSSLEHRDYGQEPGRQRRGRCHGRRPRRHVGRGRGRQVQLPAGADGRQPRPGIGPGRHVGDDHWRELHRRHGGRFQRCRGHQRRLRLRYDNHGHEPGRHRRGRCDGRRPRRERRQFPPPTSSATHRW